MKRYSAINVIAQDTDTEAQNAATEKRQLALLLHYAGPEVTDVYDTLPGEGAGKDTFTKTKPLLQAYFQPKKNV